MSDSWIKMRTCLITSPKVVGIAVALGLHPSAVCGACFAVWCVADTHSRDGQLPGYTYAVLDQIAGVPGLCAAMERVGWAKCDADGVVLPAYGAHNGSTAKGRATAARRASRKRDRSSSRASRSRHADVTSPSRSRHAGTVTKSAPEGEGEREREEKRIPPAATQRPPRGATRPAADADLLGTAGTVRYRVSTAEFVGIDDAQLAAWEAAYPAVDVPVAIRQAAAWVAAERGTKGRKANYGRFLAAWMAREQERGGGRAPKDVPWTVGIRLPEGANGTADEIARAERARAAMLAEGDDR